LHELRLFLDSTLSIIYLLETLGKYLDLSLHLAFELFEFVLFSLKLLLGILTLLDQEEIFFLKVGEDVKKLVRVLEEELVLVV
jgi:hypothetical protein